MVTCQLESPEVAEEAKAEATFLLRNMRQLEPGRIEHVSDRRDRSIHRAVQEDRTGHHDRRGRHRGHRPARRRDRHHEHHARVGVRTHAEIGLRKAVGATPGAILMQFLLEAVTLCMLGGLIGVAIAEAASLVARVGLEKYGLDEMRVPIWAIVVAFAFSGGVGVIFGMFPAIKASRLDPIEALRHE
jgi:hypothetical protein